MGPSSCTRQAAAPDPRSTSSTSPLTLATSTPEASGVGPAVAAMASAKERAAAGWRAGITHSVPLRAKAYTVSRATAGAPNTASPAARSQATVSAGSSIASRRPLVVPR